MSHKPPPIPEPLQRQAREVLERLARPGGGLQAALLSTLDGFEIVCLSARQDLDGRSLAAMSGSLMAMARAVGREVRFPGCKRLTFETDGGVAIFQTVQGAIPCVLCLVHDEHIPLGQAVWLAGEITRVMEAG
jgi:predicted regulator of Ras-like GTPase activity (Roadblock/LC7/MglB family)